MIKKLSTILSCALVISFFTSVAQSAADVEQVVLSGQFGQVSANNYGNLGWANATVSIEGNGVNRTAFLVHASDSPSTGYNLWRGSIPADAVTVTGVASISVNIDTCSVSNIDGCGPVYFTVTTNEPASGWIDNGTRQYNWGNVIYREAGSRQVRFSSSTGSIHGIPVNNSRAFMGKYNEVTISITTPE